MIQQRFPRPRRPCTAARANFLGISVRDCSGNGNRHTGVGSKADHRFDVAGIEGDRSIVFRSGICGKRKPTRDGLVPLGPLRRHWPAREIFERRVVGGDHTRASTAFDGHIANRHASVHVETANRRARVFDDASGSTGRSDLRDDVENDVLRCHAFFELAGYSGLEVLRLPLQHALTREHVADFRVPMPKASAPNAPCVEV